MTSELPEDFKDLTPFIDWARPTELGRNEKRWSATLEESKQFYDTMLARGPAALEYLSQYSLHEIVGPDRALLDLCLALAEAAATIEMYEDPQPKYVFPIQRFIPTHDEWPLAEQGDKK
ncbi:hypothetical protein [Hyphococcus sp. DH-69]|uniref:hypothetical protein n=1 Tax=Hyphococcus formosus TaxID=3143534 RepID=UPI00398B4F5C